MQRIIFTVAILVYFLIGIAIFRDVGLSMDEPFERDIGMSNVKFLLHKLNLHRFLCDGICEADLVVDLDYLPDRIYGSWFQIVSIALEAITGASGMEIFHIRHLLLFYVGTVGLVFLYRTIAMLYKNEWIALAVALLFAIQPRFFGESFYNSKDMLLVAITHIAFYYLLRFLRRPWRRGFFITAGVLTGLTIATRVTAIMMFTGVLILLLVDLTIARRRRRVLIGIGGYVLASAFFSVLFWPYLWKQPVAHFFESVAGMSRYPLHTQVLLNGQILNSANLPWDYVLQWILVTVPELIILLLIAGVATLFLAAIRREGLIRKYRRLKSEVFAAGLFL
ncbi:MAG: glycosyltransferase family 39 protein, partial [Leptospirales bacterium]|nr:glycosyltransferase family 39 protein [Leptospirales bacterium]